MFFCEYNLEKDRIKCNVMIVTYRYVEEHVQKTGVAIETQGFTFVTSGRKRESLTVSIYLRPNIC